MSQGKQQQLVPLQINEVAAWWPELRREGVKPQKDVEYATLPAIQRGFVWNADQIETMWDSIVRGFPIGSILLSEFTQGGKEQHGGRPKPAEIQSDQNEPSHYLLDGQQRTTSVATGFRNVWSDQCENRDDIHSALWVDINQHSKDRQFLFRLVTQSHPWGYSKDNPNKTLSSAKSRDALNAYRRLLSEGKRRPHEFKIYQVFPWDADAPLPLALLLEAVGKHGTNFIEVKSELKKILSRTELWKNPDLLPEKLSTVMDFLDDYNDRANSPNDLSGLAEGFTALVKGLHAALTEYRIPAIILPVQDENSLQANSSKDEHDPTFTLFERINTKGTPLTAEDIKYSLLKMAWPEAPEVIEVQLLGNRKIAQPARMVSLMSRLYLMTKVGSQAKGLQPELSMKQFREIVREIKAEKVHVDKQKKEKYINFKEFCLIDGMKVVGDVWDLLTKGQYALPNVLAAQLTQKTASDLMLLLMYWVKLNTDQLEVLKKEKDQIQIRKILGFITALAWFAPDPSHCARSLAKKLLVSGDPGAMKSFFSREQFLDVLHRDGQSMQMVPLPSPDTLKKVLLYVDLENNLKTPSNTGLWAKQLWEHYGVDRTPEDILNLFGEYWGSDVDAIIRNKWYKLIDSCLIRDRRLLIYAQRKYISKWFDWFDPTQPDQIHDRNRPWDYDHILPKSWSHPGNTQSRICSDIPELVRIWVWANGNFRAWPLEHNRSKSNIAMLEENLVDYGLENINDVLDASFILGSEERGYWQSLNKRLSRDKSDSEDSREQENKMFWEEGEHWSMFVHASIARTVDIYREWYVELKIADLMEKCDD